jgi:hypothetical protein
MTRRRFIQDRETLEFHEVGADYEPDVGNTDSVLWGDRHYEGLRATDGADISSRSKHREYMRRHGLTTVDDFNGDYWRNCEAKRNAAMAGVDPNRKYDIARALAKLEKERR